MIELSFRTQKSARTFETVLEAATELFRRKGFHGTTMRDIARESGLGLGALYYYFRSKEELVLRFYEHNSERTLEAFRSRPKIPENLAQALTDFLYVKLEHLHPYRELMYVVMKEAVDPESPLCPLNPASARFLSANIDLFRELIEQTGAAEGEEAQEIARGLWMAQMAILAYWLHDRSPEGEATRRAIGVLGSVVRLSTAMKRIPGLSALRRQVLGLISNLFRAESEPIGATQRDRDREPRTNDRLEAERQAP